MKTNSKDRKIVVIGARVDGHAGVVIDLLEKIGGYKLIGFIDNTPKLKGKKIYGKPVIGSTDNLDSIDIPADCVHIAIGDNVTRARFFEILKKRSIEIETLIDPTAVISRKANIAKGCFIGAKAVINNGCFIGPVSIINTGAIIEHDNHIGAAVHMAPATKTAGRVIIDTLSFIGIGATILPDIHIGSGAMIGAGATVVKNVSDKETVIGYAAKKHIKNIYAETKPDIGVSDKIYVAQPTLPEYPLLDEKFRDISNRLMLSNFAKYSNELERKTEKMLKVKRALTFPNATSALMLALKAIDLTGEVILPSFTFSATGHALIWNKLTPVFADIDPHTFTIDPKDVRRKITDKTSAIIGVHVFGVPADIDRLEDIAKKHKLKLIFDSAHALGSVYKGKPIGSFGDIECFSLSGTKVITSAEGGIATSNNKKLMEKIDIGRNYGAADDYNCQYMGLNGKMSEYHAAIALESLPLLAKFVEHRNRIADLYKKRLEQMPGISFQYIPKGCVTTYKDFAIIVDKKKFGMDRDSLIKELNKEGIFPKRYFYPPLHEMKAYRDIEHRAEGLHNTEVVANNIVCLPIYSHMSNDTVEKICSCIEKIYKICKLVTDVYNSKGHKDIGLKR